MAWWEYLIPGYNVARAGYGAATGNWGVGGSQQPASPTGGPGQPPTPRPLGPDGQPLPPGPQDYTDPNTQMLSNWWEPMYGQDYAQFGQGIDAQTRRYGSDYDRYQQAGDRAYGVGPDQSGDLPSGMQYTPDEQSGITQFDRRMGAMTTPDEYAAISRTGEEQGQISGDPYAGFNQFQEGMGGLNRDLDTSEQRTFDTLGEQDRNVRDIGSGYGQSVADQMTTGAGGIRGAVTTGRGDFNSAIGQGEVGFRDAVSQGSQGYGSAIREGSAGIRSATGAPDLQLDAGYGGRIRGVLDAGAEGARGVYQNPDLLASEDFMNSYQFGPEDMEGMETLAGTAAGARYRDMQSEIERRAAAGGQTSASAMASIKERYGRQSAQEAADAVLRARMEGRGMQLDTIRGREQVRLGAQQTQAGMATGAELELGGRNLQAETMTEQMRLAAAARARQMQQQGETDIMGARTGAETNLMGARMTGANQTMGARTGAARDLMAATQGGESDILHSGLTAAGSVAQLRSGNELALGNSRLGAYGQLRDDRIGVGEFGTQGAAGYQAAGEGTASNRAANAADTRTDAARYAASQRYGQESGTADRLAAANSQIADARLAGGREQRAYTTGMTGLNSQGQLTSTGQRQQQFGTRFGAANAAAGQAGGYATQNRQLSLAEKQQPKPWERLVGGVVGAAGGYFAGGG